MLRMNLSNSLMLSQGPGALSGWNCTEKTLFFLSYTPSTVLSSRLMCVTVSPVPFNDFSSTA